jgi:NAD(P)-dependent dehydrogenase (short-subunit alcohol dehydrogenase family)
MATVEGCRAAVDAALAGLGGLDVLVSNAGIWHPTASYVTGIAHVVDGGLTID